MNDQKLNVLIVDDEPLITIFIKHIVKEMGDNVVAICHDSDSAISCIKSEKPDLIFMDINIKGPLDGISVIKKAVNYSPIIYYISAYNSNEIIGEALSTNPYNYLVKPIKEEDIKIALTLGKTALGKHQKHVSTKILLGEDLYYESNLKSLFEKGVMIELSGIEQKLVELFVSSPNINLAIEQIKDQIWKDKDVANSTIRDKISQLRKKVAHFPIKTNFGRGYMLEL